MHLRPLRCLGLLLAMAACGLSGNALALCDGGRPKVPLSTEVVESDFIVIGKLMSYRRVADPDDPEGYAATLYRVHVESVLHGRAPDQVRKGHLTIRNDNTSARFPFDDPVGPGAGKAYLMLVRGSPDGYWIDACGHSGTLEESGETIRLIRTLGVRGEPAVHAGTPAGKPR